MIIPNLNEMDVEHWFRQVRNDKLFESDWTQTIDSPLTESKKTEWATYRQALRDLPSTATPTLDDNGNLQNVNWPDEPK